MKISTLGPKSRHFSHEAVLKYDKKADIVFEKTIWGVFEGLASGRADKGIVPLENSISGTVGMTFDALMDFDLVIEEEIIIPIKHYLASNSAIKDIRYIYSNSQAFAQCEKFIREKLPQAGMIEVASNSKAAEELSARKEKGYAAIVPFLAMKKLNLQCVAKDIRDNRFNVTRFIVLSNNCAKHTGHDRTSIAIYPHADRPGLLYSLIGEFASRKINLTKIESRPSKGRLGDYIFFIDLQGHKDDKQVKSAFKAIEKDCFLKILGCYPRQY